MSMPPSVSYPDFYWRKLNNYPPESTQVTVVKVASSSSKSPKKALPPRIKTWVYKGRVYERQSGWIYPPKKQKIAPETWRPPKAYSANLQEGNVSTTNSYLRTVTKPPPGFVPDNIQYYGECPNSPCLKLPAFPGFDPGLESRAITKALSKLKDQKINLAVAFAERSETARLLVGTLAGLAKAAHSLRNGNMRGVARGLGLMGSPKSPKGKNFHQKWLELQYGWQPLYSDVFGVVEALHAADVNSPQRYEVTVDGRVSSKRTLTRADARHSQWPEAKAHSTTEIFEGASVRLDYYLRNPLLASLSALGITNPALVVWERVPFSFVVDWFLPVGNYLSSLDAALGYDFRGGSCTRIYRQRLSGNINPGDPFGGYYPIDAWGTTNSRSLNMSRIVYASSPLPRVPGFKNPFPRGSTHIANAIALFASSLKG